MITEYAKKIIKRRNISLAIALDIGKSWTTVYRWVNSNSDSLKREDVIKSIKKHTRLKRSEIFEK